MKRKRFTEEQIAFALRQAESGAAVTEITRKPGVSEQTFYRWKRKYAGLGVVELRRLLTVAEVATNPASRWSAWGHSLRKGQ